MVDIIEEYGRIEKIIHAKQRNEQEMLKRLNQAFSDKVAYEKMKTVVLSAMMQMLTEAWGLGSEPVRKAMEDEKGLPCWAHIGEVPEWRTRILKMVSILRAGHSPITGKDVDINDLSNLIRVIGAWLENGGGAAGYKDISKAFRPGDLQKQLDPEVEADVTKRWEELQSQIWGPGFRQRKGKEGGGLFDIDDHVKSAWVKPNFGGKAGVETRRVFGTDLCFKIDNLLGLLPGLGISGTTTDTVMFMEVFGATKSKTDNKWYTLHPAYYLFPVATIAASLHHTLLEAGLALALDGAIDEYHVGFYTSLDPGQGFPNELSGVHGILEGAEKDIRNKHYLLWYDNGDVPKGCVVFDKPDEIADFRQLVAGRNLLNNVQILPEYPSKRDVMRFIHYHGPKRLFDHLPPALQHEAAIAVMV